MREGVRRRKGRKVGREGGNEEGKRKEMGLEE